MQPPHERTHTLQPAATQPSAPPHYHSQPPQHPAMTVAVSPSTWAAPGEPQRRSHHPPVLQLSQPPPPPYPSSSARGHRASSVMHRGRRVTGVTPEAATPEAAATAKCVDYALAARTVPPIKPSPAGNFRLQLSHCGIKDANVAAFLRFARDQLLEAFAETPEGATARAALGRDLGFADVPVVEVTLNRNNLGDAAMPLVADFVRSNPHIRSLELLSNTLTDASAPELAALARSSALQRIKIGDNAFTEAGAVIIAQGMREGDTKLMQLHLSGNNIGDRGMFEIASACARSPVEVLGLRELGIGDDGWGAVGELLAAPTGVVKEIHLKGNVMSDAAARQFVAPIVDLGRRLGAAPAVKSLGLPHCGISPTAAAELCRALRRCPHLVQLDLSNNPLGDEGGRHVATWLTSGDCEQLAGLKLARTGISTPTVEALVSRPSATSSLQTLTSLDLGFNHLTGEGAGAIVGQLLAACTSLLTFNAYHCHIAVESVALVCDAIHTHPTLTDVDFSANFSGDENAAAWARIAATSTRLERIILTDNELSAEAIYALVAALRDSPNRNIAFVQLGGQSKVPPTRNVVLPHIQTALAEILARNRREEAARRRGEPPPPSGAAIDLGEAAAGARASGPTQQQQQQQQQRGEGPSAVPPAAELRRSLGYPVPPSPSDPTDPGALHRRPAPVPRSGGARWTEHVRPPPSPSPSPPVYAPLAHFAGARAPLAPAQAAPAGAPSQYGDVVSPSLQPPQTVVWSGQQQHHHQHQQQHQQQQQQQQPQPVYVVSPPQQLQMPQQSQQLSFLWHQPPPPPPPSPPPPQQQSQSPVVVMMVPGPNGSYVAQPVVFLNSFSPQPPQQ